MRLEERQRISICLYLNKMVVVKKLGILGMIRKVNLRLIPKGNTSKDKLKVFFSLFILAPMRKLHLTKKEILITMKSEEGLLLCGDKSINAANPDYEKPIRKFFDLKEGVFIDIGANLGKYTVFMGKKLGEKGKVISIEPEIHTVAILKKNVEINHLKNVFVIDKACSSKNGKSVLYLEGTKYSGGLHSLKKYPHHVNKTIIETETLDSIINRLKIKRVDLIKIDVEGNELEVLIGAKEILKKYSPKIICESLDEESEKGIRSILKEYNYTVERVSDEDVFAYKGEFKKSYSGKRKRNEEN